MVEASARRHRVCGHGTQATVARRAQTRSRHVPHCQHQLGPHTLDNNAAVRECIYDLGEKFTRYSTQTKKHPVSYLRFCTHRDKYGKLLLLVSLYYRSVTRLNFKTQLPAVYKFCFTAATNETLFLYI